MVKENHYGDIFGVVNSQCWSVTFNRYYVIFMSLFCYWLRVIIIMDKMLIAILIMFSMVTCVYFVIHVLILYFPHCWKISLIRLGRISGITIRPVTWCRTWDFVRSVSFMYGSLRRRLWDEKNKMADIVHVVMESSGDQFVLRLYND